MTLGRKPGNDIVLDSPSVSGTHCRITRTDSGWNVEDLESTNGTRVNHRQVTTAELHNGDILTLGSLPLKVEGDDLPPPPEAPPPSETSTVATRVAIHPRTTADAPAISRPRDFGKKRDSRKFWIVLILAVTVLIGLATAFFIRQML